MNPKTNPLFGANRPRDARTGAEQVIKANVVHPNFAAIQEYQREPVDRLLKMAEVVQLTGMCRSSVYNRLREGEFVPSVQVGPRSVRFPESEVRAWIAERLVERNMGEAQDARPKS